MEWPLPNAEVYAEWEEDNEYKGVDYFIICEFANDVSDGSKDFGNGVYSRDLGGEWGEKGGMGEQDKDKEDKEIEEEESSFQTFIKSEVVNVEMMGIGESSGRIGERGGIQDIGERQLGWAMTLKDWFSYSEEQRSKILNTLLAIGGDFLLAMLGCLFIFKLRQWQVKMLQKKKSTLER
ncbi:hypothetical protein HOY80DRAFT_1043341 [Tuber brumale]|nr:hypothetical protein HOY80DRAFT_1043341 [Tuber brumale]